MRGIQTWNLKVAIALINSITMLTSVGIQAYAVSAHPTQLASMKIAQKSAGNVRLVRRVLKGPLPGGISRGGGSNRGMCPKVETEVTALVPFEERPGAPLFVDVWGYTTAAHPTLWFYMPYTKTQAISTELSLVDDESLAPIMPVTSVQLPNKAGIIAVRVPTSAPALEIGKRYRWKLTLNCVSGDNSPNAGITKLDGVIVRETLTPAAMAELATAKGVQKAAIYAANGFWHDALTTLAELRRKDFADITLKSNWQSLLESMMMSGSSQKSEPEGLVDQPFVN